MGRETPTRAFWETVKYKSDMRTKKLLNRIIIFGLIPVSFCLFTGYQWITKYSWKKISSAEEMRFNGKQILDSPKLPVKFYEIYDLIKPNQRHTSMLDQIKLKLFRPHTGSDCKCDDIGYIVWNNDNIKLEFELSELLKQYRYWYFGFGLEQNSNPEKCFDFWINNAIPWKSGYLNNLSELSDLTIGKNLNELGTDEILMLIAWHDMLTRGRADVERIQKRYEFLKTTYEYQQSLQRKADE